MEVPPFSAPRLASLGHPMMGHPMMGHPMMGHPMTRRQLLQRTGGGFGGLALAALLADESAAANEAGLTAGAAPVPAPMSAKRPHLTPRAKRVIFLFMPGGPSQVDTFDPKPQLTRDDGKPAPKLYLGQQRNLLASPWKFQRYGESGLDVSELFPHVAQRVDDLCVIRSMVTDDPNHPGGCLLMHTGERVSSRPSLGAWVNYGLGSENRNLPGFVAIGPGPIIEGARQYGASFLPATYQGTFVSNPDQPLKNLSGTVARDRQRQELNALSQLNELHRVGRADDSRLSARIDSFELAYRMQTTAPEASVWREKRRKRASCMASTNLRPKSLGSNVCSLAGWWSEVSGLCSCIIRRVVFSLGISIVILKGDTKKTLWRPTCRSRDCCRI